MVKRVRGSLHNLAVAGNIGRVVPEVGRRSYRYGLAGEPRRWLTTATETVENAGATASRPVVAGKSHGLGR